LDFIKNFLEVLFLIARITARTREVELHQMQLKDSLGKEGFLPIETLLHELQKKEKNIFI
jgi:hypothetical protein